MSMNVATPTSATQHPSTPVPAILASDVAGASGGGGGGGSASGSPALSGALEQLWGAIGALRGALEGASTLGGDGGTGCGCQQATAGAGAMGAPDAGKSPRQSGDEKSDMKPADAKPADAPGSAMAAAGTKLKHPLEGARTSSGFGHVSSIRNKVPHGGTDLAKPTGSVIKAPAAGKVVGVETPVKGASGGSGYGNYVTIDHGNGWFTRYAHLSGSDVKKGDVVSAGQPIAKVGSTGRSTGPHLHFEIFKGGLAAGKRVDPQPFLDGKKTF